MPELLEKKSDTLAKCCMYLVIPAKAGIQHEIASAKEPALSEAEWADS